MSLITCLLLIATVHPDELSKPVLSSLRPVMAQTDETGLHALTVTTPAAEVTGLDSSLPTGGPHDHIFSLLHSLPLDLSAEQRVHAVRHSSAVGRTSFPDMSMILVVLISYLTALIRAAAVPPDGTASGH